MKFARRQGKRPNVELTSMLDVVFLLLIFFMVSTRFDSLKEVPIALPRVEQGGGARSRDVERVLLRADGTIMLGDDRVEASALAGRLGAAKKVVLAADEAVQHGEFMKLLTTLRALPLTTVQVEVKSP